jgi:hypothetical protein
MKTSEFHIPFIKSLLLVSIVTILSMLSAPYFVDKLYTMSGKTQVFTTIQSGNISESRD